MSVPAKVLWAQRPDTLFMRFEVPDALDTKVDFTASSIKFEAKAGKKLFVNELDFYSEIDAEKSGFQIKGRSVDCLIYKKTTSDSFWPRITKLKIKIHWLAIDFSRWKDEDDSGAEDFNQDFDLGKLLNSEGGVNYDKGFDPANVNMDDIDSDDDDLPDLRSLSIGPSSSPVTPADKPMTT